MTAYRRYTVSGRVQGVFFRAATQQQARSLALRGWVRNLPDGRVEVCAAGPLESLDVLERWLHSGPLTARVDAVSRDSADPFQCEAFEIL